MLEFITIMFAVIALGAFINEKRPRSRNRHLRRVHAWLWGSPQATSAQLRASARRAQAEQEQKLNALLDCGCGNCADEMRTAKASKQ